MANIEQDPAQAQPQQQQGGGLQEMVQGIHSGMLQLQQALQQAGASEQAVAQFDQVIAGFEQAVESAAGGGEQPQQQLQQPPVSVEAGAGPVRPAL